MASKPAVSASGVELTFGELFDRAERLADSYVKAGVNEGSVVALVVSNSFVFIPAFLALTKLSCVAALVSPKYKDNELRLLDEHLTPDCYVTSPTVSKVLEHALPLCQRTLQP